MKEILLNNLNELTTFKLSTEYQMKNRWQAVSYKVGSISGVGLCSGENCDAKPIELDLKEKGWYKIFLCLGYASNNSQIEVSMSNENKKTILIPSHTTALNGAWNWKTYERAEEILYRSVLLNGQKLVIDRPRKFASPVSGGDRTALLFYIRLVEMTKEEIEEQQKPDCKTTQFHFDNDYLGDGNFNNPTEYMGRLEMLSHANGDSILYEVGLDDNEYKPKKGQVSVQKMYDGADKASAQYLKYKKNIHGLVVDFAKEQGMKVYGSYRMMNGNFAFPYTCKPHVGTNFVYEDKYKLINRQGEKLHAYSYAYKEGRRFMIDHILRCLPENFDGVSLSFHRCVPVLFEQPVIDKVKELYNIDARKLPISDPRLHGVWCEYVTEFMRELKEALVIRAKEQNRKDYLVNVVVMMDNESSLKIGYDVDAWLKEGLIDSFSQGIMTFYEKLDNVLDKDGLIDLDKYKKEIEKDVLLRRNYDDALQFIVKGVEEYLPIAQKYGVDFYGALPWENKPFESQIEHAKTLYQMGVNKLLSWNTNHICKKPAVLNALKQLGDKDKVLSGNVKVDRKVLRVLSINGCDISEFDVNWKG